MQLPSRSPLHTPAPSTTTSAFAEHRLPPLGPRDCDVLSRARRHHFGPVDTQPHGGSAYARIVAAANSQWALHRQGQELPVRPGSLVSPQTLYTGLETRPSGQEIYHAVFLNARMLIHNPATGQPGWRTGHAITQLHAAPTGEQPWPEEVPYSTARQLREKLPGYSPSVHAELGRQRRYGKHQITIDRRIERRSGVPEFSTPPLPNPLVLPENPAHSGATLSQDPRPLNCITDFLHTLPPWRPAPLAATAPAPFFNTVSLEDGEIDEVCAAHASSEEGTGKRPDTPYPVATLRAHHDALRDKSPEVLNAAYALAMLKRGRARTRPPVANARLERLQYEVRQSMQAGDVDIDGLPRYVLNAGRIPNPADDARSRETSSGSEEEQQVESPGSSFRPHEASPSDSEMALDEEPRAVRGREMDAEGNSGSDEASEVVLGGEADAEGDTDDEYMEAREAEPLGTKTSESTFGTAARTGAAGKHAIIRDYFSYRPSSSSSSEDYSPAPHLPTRSNSLSPILTDADVTSFAGAPDASGPPPGFLLNSSTL
ncbi:hypothetical protein C8R47DRAFT_1207202 [Mycena vitilis]|nr:hypothetical protein C8R47DRAFT_1207202 [Mycena vitilis]